MKVCIVGAGAIGGFIGTRLAAAGRAQVCAVARGATLHALRTQQGWRLMNAPTPAGAGDSPRGSSKVAEPNLLESGSVLTRAPARASDRPAELGVQDLVIVAVKAPALPGVAQSLAPLLGPHTIVMPAMNGMPWWFCQGRPEFGAVPLQSVDPGGVITQALALARVIGCVVHASTSTPEPGLVQHRMGQGLIIGEPAGGGSERVQRVGELLAHAGFDVTQAANVRHDIWYKLWGNMTMNPVSAITGATIDQVLADPLVRSFCSAAMLEAAAIGERIGCTVAQSPDDRHAVTARLGAFKTSMLQDVQAGRPMELDAVIAVVYEMGQRLGLPVPNIAALLGLARLFGRVHGLYPHAA